MNTPQSNHRKDLMSPEVKHNRAIFVNFIPCRYDDDGSKDIPTKNFQTNAFVVFQLWNSPANISVKLQDERTSIHYLALKWKKLIPFNYATKIINTMKKTRSLSKLFHLCLNNIWEPGPRHIWITRNPVFPVLTGQKHVPCSSRSTIEQIQWSVASFLFKKQRLL